jgi:hypothetical protein
MPKAIFTSNWSTDEQAAREELLAAISAKTAWIRMEGRLPETADFSAEELAIMKDDPARFNAAMYQGCEMAARMKEQIRTGKFQDPATESARKPAARAAISAPVQRIETGEYVALSVTVQQGRRLYEVALHFNADGKRGEVRTYFGRTPSVGRGFVDFQAARDAYKSGAAVQAVDLAEEAIEAYLAAEAPAALDEVAAQSAPPEVDESQESDFVVAARRYAQAMSRTQAAGYRAAKRIRERYSLLSSGYRQALAAGRTFGDTRRTLQDLAVNQGRGMED